MQFLMMLKDHVNVTHKQFEIQFENETTIAELKDEIASMFNIPSQFQRLFHEDGTEINRIDLNDSITKMGLKHMDVLIIKHGLLDSLITYISLVKDFEFCQEPVSKQKTADIAVELYDSFRKSNFFLGYSRLYLEVLKMHKPLFKYLDKKTKWIENAAINYFKLSMFRGQNPDINFESTSEGTRPAVICHIEANSAKYKYRIKTNHDAGDSSIASRFDIDLIELYLYKLLDAISVGSKIILIPDCVSSHSIVYIASQWMPKFQTINSIPQDDMGTLTHGIVQLHFLAVYLSLGDLHEENFGFVDNSLKILDFKNSIYGDTQNTFLNMSNVIRSVTARSVLEKCTAIERLAIAKSSVEAWNLVSKLDEVLELMDKEKWNFYRNELDFDKKTNDLHDFVEKVKKNIQDLFCD